MSTRAVRPRWRDARTGALAALALALLLLGVPVALWALAGWPLPTSVPSWGDLGDALGTSHVPDTVLAKALAVVCWLVWIELAASVLVEAVALVRGRRAADVPLAGPLQKLAGRLVAAAALLAVLSASRGEAVEPAAPPALLVPGAPVVLDIDHAPQPAVAPGPALPTYTVQHRDTLWDVAERHLGDPFRWTEIWELNRDRTQPDGVTFREPDLICTGWTLQLPGDAVGLDAAPAAVAAATSPAAAASIEVLQPLDDDGPRPMLAVDHDAELLVPLDAPAGDRGN